MFIILSMRCLTESDPPARRPGPELNANKYKSKLEAALKCRKVMHARAIRVDAVDDKS